MKIKNKYITVDFMPGENIYDCISQAQEFAIKNYATVKFNFNGVSMTLTPDFPADAWFDKNGQLFKTAKKDWAKYIERHCQEYRRKFDKKYPKLLKPQHEKRSRKAKTKGCRN